MIRLAMSLALMAGAADAQSVKLSGYEIDILLSGNTAVGIWDGISYRQYFAPDGSTIFAQKDVRSTRGEWRVEGEEYQSLWSGDAEWEGWLVMEYAGQWYWVSKTTPPTPFDVLEGEKLIAE